MGALKYAIKLATLYLTTKLFRLWHLKMCLLQNNNARVKVNCYMVAHTKISEYGLCRLQSLAA